MDDMTGQVLKALKDNGLEDNTIVIFTSDHGYHLGEHDFWAKVSLMDESVKVPLIIKVPGKKAAVCDSFVELLDLFPTTASLCGLGVPKRIQGKDLRPIFDNPQHSVKGAIVSANGKGVLIQTKEWAYMEYKKGGAMLYDMQKDPKQYTNLIGNPEYKRVLETMKKKLAAKLVEIKANDLGKGK